MPSELNLKSAHELAGLVKSKMLQSSFRTLVITVVLAAIGTMTFAACGGGDDSATKTPGASSTTQQSTATKTAGATTSSASAAATTTAASKTTGAGSTGGVYDVSSGKVPFEVCDVFTAQVVGDALGETVGDFENNSLGKQIPPSPFVTGEQCEWKNYTSGDGDGASVNASFTATADEAQSQLEKDCAGQESVDVGNEGCYPQFTGQLRAVKGNVYMVFMLGLSDSTADFKGIEKKLAEATIANLP